MTIAEVSKKFGLSIDTLRYYERIGLIPPVNRNENGVRMYTDKNCEWVYFTKSMRTVGISIEILIDYVTMFQQGNSTIKARKKLLINQRDRLVKRIEEMKQILQCLNNKIDGYEDKVIK